MTSLESYINDIISERQNKRLKEIVETIMSQDLNQDNGFRYDSVPIDKNNGSVTYAMNNNQSGNNGCVGSYPVEGYTRKDGTKVDGYVRTCGAAHEGDSTDNSTNDSTNNNSEDNYSNDYPENDSIVLQGQVEENRYLDDKNSIVLQNQVKENLHLDDNNSIVLQAHVEENQYLNENNLNRLGVDVDIQKVLTQTDVFNKNLPVKDYYKIALDLAEHPEKVVSNERNKVFKVKNLPNTINKKVVLDKISRGLNLDLNNPEDMKKAEEVTVVVPTENSKLVKVIKRSDKIKDLIKNKYQDIINDKLKDKYLDGGLEFDKTQLNIRTISDKFTLFGVIHNADIYDIRQNEDSISLVISDFYDFDYLKIYKNDETLTKGIKIINNRAYEQQKAGKLKPYVLYIPIELTFEELKELIQEQNKRK